VADGPVTGQAGLKFGGLLRRLRDEAGLTQDELAEAAGVSQRAVSDLERGVNVTARKDTAVLLAIARDLRAPLEEARALEGLGQAHLQDGNLSQATAPLRQALAIASTGSSPMPLTASPGAGVSGPWELSLRESGPSRIFHPCRTSVRLHGVRPSPWEHGVYRKTSLSRSVIRAGPCARRWVPVQATRRYADGFREAWSFVLASLARTWSASGCCRSSRMASACCQACRACASSPAAWRVSPRWVRVAAWPKR
jgi:transcriptional regulator with XRE-family HTH domain